MNAVVMGIPAKIAVLQKVREEKDILFAPVSDTLSKEMKHNCWKEIGELAESLGILRGKPWQYVRDTLWANWKKRTLAKLDTAMSTISINGNPESKFNAIDKLVLDIVGVEEINTGFENVDSVCSNIVLQDNDLNLVGGNSVEILPLDLPQRSEPKNLKRKATRHVGNNIVLEKKTKLLDLQIEYLELRKYTMSLQALALERRLKLPASKYTEDITHPKITNYNRPAVKCEMYSSTASGNENHECKS